MDITSPSMNPANKSLMCSVNLVAEIMFRICTKLVGAVQNLGNKDIETGMLLVLPKRVILSSAPRVLPLFCMHSRKASNFCTATPQKGDLNQSSTSTQASTRSKAAHQKMGN